MLFVVCLVRAQRFQWGEQRREDQEPRQREPEPSRFERPMREVGHTIPIKLETDTLQCCISVDSDCGLTFVDGALLTTLMQIDTDFKCGL